MIEREISIKVIVKGKAEHIDAFEKAMNDPDNDPLGEIIWRHWVFDEFDVDKHGPMYLILSPVDGN